MTTNIQTMTTTSEEAAIRDIIQAVEDGWNAGDGDAFAASFAEDADYVVVTGHYIQGRKTIAMGHSHLFEKMYKNSRNQGSIRDIRFLRDDVAVAHIEWHLRSPMNPILAAALARNPRGQVDGTEFKGNAYCTMVFTRENGRWQIAAFHNTSVQNRT